MKKQELIKKFPKSKALVTPSRDLFLIANFEIINGSKDNVAVSSIMSFNLASDSGHTFDVQSFLDLKNDLNGTIKPGRKLVGQVAFDISVESLYYLTFKANAFGEGVEFQFSSNDFSGK